jgi:uncharacterized SAM-binding protein YcdF (DUF218 family)
MYALKQLVGLITAPLVLALLLVGLGAFFRWRGRTGAAFRSFLGAAVLTYVSSTPLFGESLLAPLEHRYPPLDEKRQLPPLEYVVVLGSDYTPSDSIPITAALDSDGLARIVEGIRLMRRHSVRRLLVSGGAPAGRGLPASGYAQLAKDLGVAPGSILVSSDSLDTAGEARAIAGLLGSQPFILVTTASHMPRAVLLMQRAATHPIPAPTGQLTGKPYNSLADLLPSSAGLHATERACHEYLGLLALSVGLD